MTYWANKECADHPKPMDCPDRIIHFVPRQLTYGLPVHDGGSSFIEIKFCPWGGTPLKDAAKAEKSRGGIRK